MESETLNTLGIQIPGGNSINITKLSGEKNEKLSHSYKMSDICNRNFDHVSLEIFLTFLQRKENSFIPGVNIIADSAHNEPLRSNLITFLNDLKEQFYDLLKKGQCLPQHEVRRIETFVQTEFFKLQTNKCVHQSFVNALQSLESYTDSPEATFDITYSVDKTSVASTSQNMSVNNNLQPQIENCNNNIHINHLDSINGEDMFNYDSCNSPSSDEASSNVKTTYDHNYFCDLSTKQPIMYTATPIPNDCIQQNTTLQPLCSSEKEHSYTNADEKMAKSIAITKLPLTAPQIPTITRRSIPLIYFDNLPISSFDCYYLVLSLCLYFWSTIHWPIVKKNQITDDLESTQINVLISQQEKHKQMYFYGWVVMSVRTEIKSMCYDCNLQKDHLLTLISHLGCDKVCGNLHTGGAMYNFSGKEEIYEFFAFLDEASIQLLDKEHVIQEKQNAIKSALDKLSTCKKLRNLYFTMLNKCEVDTNCASTMETIYLLQKMVEKYMRSRQKTEIKHYNFQPQKMSSTTRGEIKAKCKKSKISALKTCDGNTAEEDLDNSKGVKEKIDENTCEDLQSQAPSKPKKQKILSNKCHNNYQSCKKKPTIEEIYKNPNLMTGAKIKHKWKVNKKYVHFNGEILGLTDPSLTPDDSDNESRSNEVCFDVKYAKYKNNIDHYRLLPDLKSGDLQIVRLQK